MSNNKRNILRESFIKTLHKKMFDDVWIWVGKFRITERNIGIKAYKIQESLKILLDDVNYWIINNTFSKREIADCITDWFKFIHFQTVMIGFRV
jgi:fido (protein-threonine AMPylation protein)